MKRVTVIGGGIAGLTAAWALKGKARVTLVEPGPLGGTIQTEHRNGFLVEGGPDSFLSLKPAAAELCRELGLGDDLIGARSRKLYVLFRNRIHELPEGFYLTVPTRLRPLLATRLLSPWGKLRAGLDLILPRWKGGEESLGHFVRRRFGREVLERIAEPLMAGIYVADADRLSLASTFPRMIELERKSRSLILGMRKIPPSTQSPFLTLRGGLGTLVSRLSEEMDAKVLRGKALEVTPNLRVKTEQGEIASDEVVVAVPSHEAARLLSVHADLSKELASIPYVSTVTVSLGFRSDRALDATGFVIPKSEKSRLLACTWTSAKFEGRAPEGHVLVRCFLVGEPEDPEFIARREIEALMGLKDPVVVVTYRWPMANPVYEVGHAERMGRIEALTPKGIRLVGSAYRGVGIPDAIQDSRDTASRILS